MLVDSYRQYREALEKTPAGPVVDYNWSNLPKRLNGIWLAYGLMLDEFSREIANSINDLSDYTSRLKAWNEILAPMTLEEKLDLTHEFIDPIATLVVNLPFVIRSRFIFAAAHLSHQANRSLDASWRDDFPLDHEIQFDAADIHGAPWKSYGRLKIKLERISDKTFRTATRDFRHAYNHRFSSRFVIGMTQTVTRRVELETVSYSFGAEPPLDLDFVVGLLDTQLKRSVLAFEAFKKLVGEQEASIARNNPDPSQ